MTLGDLHYWTVRQMYHFGLEIICVSWEVLHNYAITPNSEANVPIFRLTITLNSEEIKLICLGDLGTEQWRNCTILSVGFSVWVRGSWVLVSEAIILLWVTNTMNSEATTSLVLWSPVWLEGSCMHYHVEQWSNYSTLPGRFSHRTVGQLTINLVRVITCVNWGV